MKTAFTFLLSRITKIDWGFLNQLLSEIPQLSSAAQGNTGWDKLREVVEKLEGRIPPNYSKIASTVITGLVVIARLYLLTQKK